MDPRDVLVGDIGGTNCRLALCREEGGEIRFVRRASFLTADHASPEEAISHFLGGVTNAPRCAALAVAGPVRGDEIALTNSHWRFSLAALQQAFSFSTLVALNDLEAQAEGFSHLGRSELSSLGGGDILGCASVGVVGVGTGLGIARIDRGARGCPARVTATEGGHAGFAPHDDVEMRVLESVRAQTGRVVDEHLVSGPGLVRLHGVLAAMRGEEAEPLEGVEITRRGVSGADPSCAETVRRFALMLASVCADTVLVQGVNGVALVGDIAIALAPVLQEASFRARFEDHGPGEGFLRSTPVAVATVRDLGLLGAYRAVQRLSDTRLAP
ncbi:MAG: glucokinase [Hyphomonadaceae bacterium]|nr:MAG: glucokinase [Caulobacteraceae bacterium]MBT9445667.1 glucokinase [Hyphomonadaceae bacterium]TPW05560.1 MAG: glucokinase [Alphaproteobacteria bacterium]